MQEQNWQMACNQWLSKRRIQFLEFEWPSMSQPIAEPIFCIVTGTSPRNPEKLHAIVGRLDPCGRINELKFIHDPHFEQRMVMDAKQVGFLIPLYPGVSDDY